jgi:lysophospholipase L1-like esterase
MVCQFVLFEAALRLKGGSEAAPAFQRLFMTDSRIGYRLKPGARTHFKTSSFETDIVINSSGTRDEEIGPKAANERRILVLGDSLVLSVQVALEQTFCKRLEDALNHDPALAPYHYRVINAGVQGYGPVEEWLFYEYVASAFDADVVLVGLFVGNDAAEAVDSSPRLAGHVVPDPTRRTQPAERPATTSLWLRRTVRRSMVLQIVRLRLMPLVDRFRAPDTSGIERPLRVYLETPPADVLKGLEVTRGCVARIAAFAAARNAKTAVVLLPARLQVNDADFAVLQGAVAPYGHTLVRNVATDRFKAALADLPVPVMDALPALFNVPRRSETFFEDTVHLTPRGHQILADALAQFLRESHLVPTDRSGPVVTTGR